MLNRYPLMPAIIGYVIGIFSTKVAFLPSYLFISLGGAFILILITLYFYRKFLWVHYTIPTLVLLFFVCLGNHIFQSSSDTFSHNHYSHYETDTNCIWMGQLQEAPRWGKKRAKAIVELKSVILSDSSAKTISGSALIYFPTGDSALPKVGSEIVFEAEPFAPKTTTIPGGFDYKSYLANQDIKHTFFVKPEQWRTIGHASNWRFQANEIREEFLRLLDEYPIDSASKGIAAALLLGYKDWMEDETRDEFAVAGATHILAVSGLHVGIVYMIMMTLLGMRWSVLGRHWKMPIIILSIWAYAILTGLSPSVCRSATMFSFFALSKLLGRRGNTYHLLIISAFVLLLIDPRLIFQLSFQLSYAAVFAIVTFVPLFQKIWEPKFFLWKGLRDIIAVSIAAQMGTLPITLFHFQQFPTYFILGNLAVLPIIPLLMYFGLGSLFFNYFGWKLSVLEWAFAQLLNYLNTVVEWIGKLPLALITTTKPLPATMAYLAFFTLFLAILWKYKPKKLIITGGMALLVLALFQIYETQRAANSKYTYILQSHSGIATLTVSGKNATLLNPIDTNTFIYKVAPILKYHGIPDTNSKAPVFWDDPMAKFETKNVIFLRSHKDLEKVDWSTVDGVIWQYQGVIDLRMQYSGKIFLEKSLRKPVVERLSKMYEGQIWDLNQQEVCSL